MRKIIYIFLSLLIVFANTQTAFAASSWSITSAVSAGARTVVTATKSGYKSAVNIAPTAARLGVGLLRVGNTASLMYAAAQLGNDGIDFVIDAENNQIKYKVPPAAGDVNYVVVFSTYRTVGTHKTKESACREFGPLYWKSQFVSFVKVTPENECYIEYTSASDGRKYKQAIGYIRTTTPTDEQKTISIPAAAAQVLRNAQNGNASAQAAVRAVATEMVIGGQFDQDLLAGAVPTSDNKPLVPSVPISGNGNVTHGSDVATGDDGMSGASPGDQAQAAKDAADAAKKAAQAAADAAKDAAQAASDAADAAADLVNSGADTAAIDAAEAKAAAAEKAAADAKAVSDAAVAAANERAAAAERAAESATQAAKDAATQAAADVAAAQASGDAAAVAAAEAAKAAADAAVAAAEAAQAAAEKAAEKAKAEATKPFELPAFCSWASPVCDAIEWLKRDPADLAPTPVDVDASAPSVDASEFDVEYINFGGQCPSLPSFSVGIGGASSDITFDMTPLCNLAVTIRPAIIAISYFIGLGVVASAIRET